MIATSAKPKTYLKSIKHLCDLEGHGLLRVVSFDEAKVVIETTSKRQKRFLEIDLNTGKRAPLETTLPLTPKRIHADDGQRWAAQKYAKMESYYDTTVTWQDEKDGPVYEVTIPDAGVGQLLCPQASDRIFVAPQKGIDPDEYGNPSEYQERIVCFRRGKEEWSFAPDGDQYVLDMECPIDGRYLVFTSGKALYFLGENGKVLHEKSAWSLLDQQLTEAEKIRVAYEVYDNDEEGLTEEETDALAEMKASDPESWDDSRTEEDALPKIRSLRVLGDGKCWLAPINNVLFWFNDRGAPLRHHVLEPLGRSGHCVPGLIESIYPSETGRTVVVKVDSGGFVVFRDDELFSVKHEDLYGDSIYIDEDSGLIFWGRGKRIKVCDFSWNELEEVVLGAPLKHFYVIPRANLLCVVSEDNSLFKLEYSEQQSAGITLGSNLSFKEKTPIDIHSAWREPSWIVGGGGGILENQIKMSANGRRSAFRTSQGICVYELGEVLREVETDSDELHCRFAMLSSDGDRLLVELERHMGLYLGNGGHVEEEFYRQETRLRLIDLNGRILARHNFKGGTEHGLWLATTDGSFAGQGKDGQHYAFDSQGQFFAGEEACTLWRRDGAELVRTLTVPGYQTELEHLCYTIDRRVLTLLKEGRDPLWSIRANAKIEHIAFSPLQSALGFNAGKFTWIVDASSGETIQKTDHRASYVFPDDSGGFLSISGSRNIAKWSATGQLLREVWLPDAAGRVVRRGGLVAVSTADSDSNLHVIWVLDLDGNVVASWSRSNGLYHFQWARGEPVLAVCTDNSVVFFDLS